MFKIFQKPPNKTFPLLTKLSHSLLAIIINNYHTEATSLRYKTLLSIHLKNHRLDEARTLFDRIQSPDVHLHTMMINSYARNSRLPDALDLFDKMPKRDLICWNSMVKACVDCGDLVLARKVFDEMPERNVVSWTTMVAGYFKCGMVEEAEKLFWVMPERDVAAWNAMVHGYCQNGRVHDGMKLFEEMPSRNVISWTSMICGLDLNGRSTEGLSLFQKMAGSGVSPNSSTFACVLTACGNVRDLCLGLQVQCLVVKLGFFCHGYVLSSLISFYANCRNVENASLVFRETLSKNVVVWTALLTGYSVNCEHEDALRVFRDMMRMAVLPNQSTFTSALNSCSGLETIDKGREIHAVTVKLGFEADVFVGNSLIVMYMETGSVNHAITVFKKIDEKNVVSWNSIIVGSAQHGYGESALIFFNQMIRAGIHPDEITFTGLLSACSHSGMLKKGRHIFEYISRYKSSCMKLQHYACMVDILGRCGKLDEAEELIKSMPMKPNSMVWLALLGACRVHCNFEIAERAAKSILDLEPHCSAAYVLLSNLYASAGRWADVSRMRVQMKRTRAIKVRGSSWVVLRGNRHEFCSGDRSHPVSEKINEKLEWLGIKLKELGYIPDQMFALHDVDDEQKEELLSHHSERLAIAFALICTLDGCTITVIKNLRVCGDCHDAIKLISKIVGREIVVRDSSRFHHFRNGICSCRDYW